MENETTCYSTVGSIFLFYVHLLCGFILICPKSIVIKIRVCDCAMLVVAQLFVYRIFPVGKELGILDSREVSHL